MKASQGPPQDQPTSAATGHEAASTNSDMATEAAGTLPYASSPNSPESSHGSIATYDLRPGSQLARYQLIEIIGTGGFGTVWKARDTQLKRFVAIKIPRGSVLSAAEAAMFLREAQVAAQLKHPSIVAVHEVGMASGTHFIVEDFVEGLPLDQWLLSKKSLPVSLAVETFVTIAHAVGIAHRHAITHRDLKPSNILIDAEGNPHLLDFGLAKTEAVDQVLLTRQGQVLGTPAYMSPEQARGDSQLADTRSDVYSLGVIFFELLTGERPFRGTSHAVLKQTIENPAPSPRTLDTKIPIDLETIVLKCLEKSPAHRFQDAGEIEAELRRFLSGLPISIRSQGPITRFLRWFIYNPEASTTTTGITFIVLGLLFTIWCASGAVAVAVGIVGNENPRAALLELLMAFVFVWLPLILTGSAVLKQRRGGLVCAFAMAVLCFGLTLLGAIGVLGREDLHGSLDARRPLYFLLASIFALAVVLSAAALFSQRIRKLK